MNIDSLKPSHLATVRHINEIPGTSTAAIGFDYAIALTAAGLITVRRGRCYPTAEGARLGRGRTDRQIADDHAAARATLIGRWGTR